MGWARGLDSTRGTLHAWSARHAASGPLNLHDEQLPKPDGLGPHAGNVATATHPGREVGIDDV